MKNTLNSILALALALLAACGAPAEDLFDDAQPDAGMQLGTVEQGMSTKFSSLYTHGLSAADTSKKAMVALGCGAGQTCLLPGKGLVRFKVTGFDPHENTAQVSWKYQARRALNDSFRSAAVGWGNPWPFGHAIEEDTANTWLEVTNGDCHGDGSGNDITEFACLQWTIGNSPIVTESQVGTYRRFSGTGKLKIVFDNEAMDEKCLLSSCQGNDFHELVEHAAHALAPAAFGSGVYLTDQLGPTGTTTTWSSPTAMFNDSRRFSRSQYTLGELCRAGNWSSAATGEFTQATGSCPN